MCRTPDNVKREQFHSTLARIDRKEVKGDTHSRVYRRLRRRLVRLASELPPGYVIVPEHLAHNVPRERMSGRR